MRCYCHYYKYYQGDEFSLCLSWVASNQQKLLSIQEQADPQTAYRTSPSFLFLIIFSLERKKGKKANSWYLAAAAVVVIEGFGLWVCLMEAEVHNIYGGEVEKGI